MRTPQVQTAFDLDGIDDLGTPLAQVTFVVVDLETTGGSPRECGITEIGAVKVRGGEVLGELSTLVNPGMEIPPFIAALTGITAAMVASAPRIEAVLPSWLEFSHGAVIVAHNAAFDVGFLKAAAERHGMTWRPARVLDTVQLARQVLDRDEVRNHKLATLAPYFRATTTPTHRALDDARATVDVLHGLLERVGGLGVHTWEDLHTYRSRVTPEQRRKRHLADGLPKAPGVYLFTGPGDEVLYVGTSTNIGTRVRSYFTAAETRRRMSEMVALATGVTPIVCQTRLEAQVRELRLIAEHAPRYNRRSKHPARAPWVKLTDEAFPRLSVVRNRHGGGTYLGPFGSVQAAAGAVAALHEAFPLRQCVGRLPLRPRVGASACLLADLGKCGAPCVGRQGHDDYSRLVERVQRAINGAVAPVSDALLARIARLSTAERFEEAAHDRDRLESFLRAAARTQHRSPLESVVELVAARRAERGGWEIVLVRHGGLAGTTVSPPGADPRPYVAAVKAAGALAGGSTTLVEETELIGDWLSQPGVRLVELDGEWSCPLGGAAQVRRRLSAVRADPGPRRRRHRLRRS